MSYPKSFIMPFVFMVSIYCGVTSLFSQTTSADADYVAAARCSHSQKEAEIFVMVRGEIVFEDCEYGWHANRPHYLASGTKSFRSVIAVCVVQDSVLDLNEKVTNTITEWKSDDRKSQIMVRQLLSLCSGIDSGDNGSVPGYNQSVSIAQATAKAKAGTKFSYGPRPIQCFGELMCCKLDATKESVEEYLYRRAIEPIGMKIGFWTKDIDGNINLPSGAFLTPREWVKLCEFARLGGKCKESETFPTSLLAECFKPSTAQSFCGMNWWLLGHGDEGATEVVKGSDVVRLTGRHLQELPQLNCTPPGGTPWQRL